MSTTNQIDIEAQKDPATLEREIDQQRAEINHIVEALETKLSPGELVDKALGYAKGNGGEFLNNLGATVKANPVPTLLTGIGLAWLMAGQNRRPPGAYGYTETGTGTTSTGPSLGERLHDSSAQLKGRATQLRQDMDNARHRVSVSVNNARARMGDSSRRARDGFDYLRQEQPLALGAIGIAVGALLAITLPPTRREDELLGETRDRMATQLRQKAEEGYQKVSAKGEELAGQMQQERTGTQAGRASGPH